MKIVRSLLLAFPLFCVPAVFADTFSAWDENDFFGHWSDKYYTNHTRFAYTYEPESTPDQRYFFSIGQEIYTPRERYVAVPPANDHPYAGFLYGSLGIAQNDANKLFSVELQLGVLGPSALGEQIQRDYHKIIGADIYDGWDTQIKDQPGINLLSEYRIRMMLSGTLGEAYASDLIIRGFSSLGTVRTQFSGGAQVRYGLNLPSDFGYTSMRQSTSVVFSPNVPVSFYVFADIQADLTLYDATLGGDWFRSHDSDIYAYPLAVEATVGIAASYGNWSAMLFQSFRSRDFSSADKTFFAFGGIRITYSF